MGTTLITKPSTTESLDFKMHPELLRSVIQKQAGTIGKAVLEGAMNSIDAGSSRVDITLTPLEITIADDGKGFTGRDEIESFFRTFGQPHTDGDARFGRFRMGRGQMFAFGVNSWRTGQFKMHVDISEKIGFDLDSNLENAPGCYIHIKLFDALSTGDIYSVHKEIQHMLKWSDIPVYLNDVQINKSPSEANWGIITDEAYIKIVENARTLDVYNDGVFVESIGSWKYGVGGTIVSRQTLDVNFARNQVLEKCPVWKKIKAVIDQRGEKTIRQKLTLTEDERVNVINRIKAGTMKHYEAMKMKIFMDVKGQVWSFNQIMSAKFPTYSVAPANDHAGDSLMQRHLAFVLAQDNADLFEVPYDTIFAQWTRSQKTPLYTPIEELSEDIDTTCYPLPKNKWTAKELLWFEIIRYISAEIQREKTKLHPSYGIGYEWNSPVYQEFRDSQVALQRDIRIGISETALAWTDGATYIYYSRDYLKRLTPFVQGAPNVNALLDIIQTTIHEFCHDTDSRDNVHSPEFYQAFHDWTNDIAPSVLSKTMNFLTPAKHKAITDAIKKRNKNVIDDLETE